MGRLNKGKGRQAHSVFNCGADEVKGDADTLAVWQHASMAEVLDRAEKCWTDYWDKPDTVELLNQEIRPIAMNGDAKALPRQLADAEELVSQAIAADPSLARQARWQRGEEGEIACPALVAQGDDAPCFWRKRQATTSANGGEPVRVVISTDGVPQHDRTAAFIATVQIVQQWRRVEVFWQGAWLNVDRTAGWVFHVPLITGDMDYSRLQFVLANRNRDAVSWANTITHNAENERARWGSCSSTAFKSYLPGEPAHFIRHEGITPDGESIASRAREWIG